MRTTDSLGKDLRNPHRTHAVAAARGNGACLLAFLGLMLPCALGQAAQLKEARVTQVIRDVKLLPGQAAPRPAAVSDQVREGTAVRTGTESRAELTFTDQTLARLGANTIFSFNQGTRNLDLGGGAMLLRVPKNSGGAQINTAAVTAAITGTTVMLEYHPNAYIKYIILEGTGRIFRKGQVGESVLLHAGQMLIVNPNGKGLPDPVDVDLDRLVKTSLLINGFDPLPSGDLIAQAIRAQDSKKGEGDLIETNLVIFGNGTTVALLDPTHTDVLDQANANEGRRPSESPSPTMTPAPTTTPTPTMTPVPTMTPTPTVSPTPEKFGTPPVIASSTPYQITSDTVIATDPAITTNGKTDFGKIYRDPETDGSISTYLFTAASAFDQAIQFDQRFQVIDLLPLAVFKFSALQLTGNPTISLANDGAVNLALISVGDITSGAPGGTLTFAGLHSLILATENGSIALSSALAFQDIPSLGIYARGKGSNLTLDATITGTTNLFLAAEGNILFTNPLILTQISNGAPLGLFTVVISGGDLIGGNDFTILNDNSAGDLSAGASIVLQTGGNFILNNDADFSCTIMNNGGGHIGVGGDIFVSTGGDFTANAIDALINNRDGGTIDIGGNLTFDVGGALTTASDVSLVFSNRDDGGGGGTAGSGFVSLSAGSVDIGGLFTQAISLSGAGGSLGQATATIDVSADLVTGGGLDFSIQNGGTTDIGQTPGGIIDNYVLLTLSTGGSFSSDDFLTALITNLDGGQIGGNATLIFGVGGDISITNDALWQIINTSSAGLTGSTIGSDGSITLSGSSLTAGSLFGQVFNTGGSSIGNDAIFSFDLTGAITTPGAATFRIVNFDDGFGNGGGTIGGDATVSIAAQSLSAATLLVRINNLGGTINGDASVNVILSGALITTGNATFDILQDLTLAEGVVGGNSSVTVSAGSIAIGGTLLARISDLETSIDFDNVTISAAGDISADDQILVDGNLSAGGNISGVNGITITGGSLTAGGDITSSAGAISQTFGLNGEIGTIAAGGDIFAAGSLNAFYFDTSITAGGSITASDIGAVTVVAGSNITIGEPLASPHYIFADSFSAGGAISLINVGNIQSITATATGGIGFTPDPFTLSALSISSAGPAIADLLFDGQAPDPTLGNDNPGNGGLVILSLTGDGLTIGSAGDIASITANGGPFAFDSTLGGNGGTVNITTTGDVTLNGPISATTGTLPTGALPDGGFTTLGNGGTVNITTAGTITVNSSVEVSSDVVEGTPVRRSAKGGNITLTSTKATAGAAITVANSGQLLALLDQAAPGPGGKITILASGGGGSSVNVHGTAVADRGTVDIRHTGANGTVNLSDASGSNFVFLHGDVVKVGALGNNGLLTIGQGSISADDTLKLYGASANGEVRFVDNVTIGGQNFTIIAADTVTINNSKVVTVNGARADVYVGFDKGGPKANYTGFGGNGNTTGTFAGAGANNPQPIENAPPFDGPPGG